jgi:hypothetical protein
MSTEPVGRAAYPACLPNFINRKNSLLFFAAIKYYFKKKELSSQL